MKKGFTLVELMIVVGVIAILAAIGLPMYSTFKQKSKVGAALRGCSGTVQPLQAFYDDSNELHDGFTDIDVLGPDGGSLAVGAIKVGVGLPQINGMTWEITVDSRDSITIGFYWEAGSGCPSAACDGFYCIDCQDDLDKCFIGITVGDGSLGFDRTPSGAAAPASCP